MKVMTIALTVALQFPASPSRATLPQTAAMDQGVDAVEVIKATATVEKIDLEKRKVTLLTGGWEEKDL